MGGRLAAWLVGLLWATVASAQPATSGGSGGPDSSVPSAAGGSAGPNLATSTATPPGDPLTADPPVRKSELAAQNERLMRELAQLRQELASLREDQNSTSQQVRALSPLSTRFSGYLDVGFFYVSGDGTGIRSDTGYAVLPQYRGVVPDSWVFLGDPLATTINSRGDPANTGESRAVTFNPIGNKGTPSFLVNNLNLALFVGLSENLQVNALIDFLPRGRNVSNPDGLFLGDFLDVKLGYVEYTVPTERFGLSLYAGKFDSVLGYEYRVQEAPDRITVTPSLICRYTCGRPIGLKARFTFLNNRLNLNAALTNGSSFVEQFPLFDETDSNYFQTGSLRIGTKLPVGAGLEIGASGSLGVQDQQSDPRVLQWHFGFDLHLDVRGFEVQAEFVQGRASGKTESTTVPCDAAPCLDYRGAYGLFAYRVTNWLMPYARIDWRQAVHQSGASFVYSSHAVRFTGGLRFELGSVVVLKAEYTHVREVDPLPDFPDDVFTSSLIIKY